MTRRAAAVAGQWQTLTARAATRVRRLRAAAPLRSALLISVACSLLFTLALAAAPASAATTHPFLSELNGSNTPATNFGEPTGAAVDANGALYVADFPNGVVDVFDAQGDYLTQIADANLSLPAGIAVDSAGNVYAATAFGGVVKFSPSSFPVTAATTYSFDATIDAGSSSAVAVDPVTGDVYVDDYTQINEYDSSGSLVATIGSGTLSSSDGVGVDSSSGDIFASDAGNNVVDVFDSSGSLLSQIDGHTRPQGAFTGGGLAGLGVDQSDGHLYVVDAAQSVLDEFDATGAFVSEISGTPQHSFSFEGVSFAGVAVDNSGGSAAGDVYVSDSNDRVVDAFGPTITIPDVTTDPATNVGQMSATLNGTVNPDSTTLTDCHFDYVDDAGYNPSATNPYGAGSTAPCISTPSGSSATPVSADVSTLQPNTTYHFRIVAANASGANDGLDQTLRTLGPPQIDGEAVQSVTSSSATLTAEINPESLASTYHFEYTDAASFQASGFTNATKVPQPDASIGSSSTDQLVSVHIQGLQANTTYDYRVVATNTTPATANGAAKTFTTQAGGAAAGLPDSRGYEMVSPPDKNDNDVQFSPGDTLGNVQVSTSGDSIAYDSLGPFPGTQAGLQTNFYLSSRGSSGWSTLPLMPPQAPSKSLYVTNGGYVGFSADFSRGLLLDGSSPQDSPPLVSGEPPNNVNLFVRDNSNGSYQLVDVTPAGVAGAQAIFAGASPDESHVLFYSAAQLTANAPAGASNLFEWVGGTVSLVSVLPDGTPAAGAVLGGGGDPVDAVSADGSHIFFTVDGNLYLRENGVSTVQVSASQRTVPDPNGPEPASFVTATPDGSRVLFTSCQKLTNDSTAVSIGFDFCPGGSAGQDLYDYNVDTGALTDLTVDSNVSDTLGAAVQGVLGSSNDGSYVYFVADGALATGASSGQPNLYLSHDGTTTFIAALTGQNDSLDWSASTPSARVTPDGQHLAFNSTASLTGYDNEPVQPGQCVNQFGGAPEPCTEIFLYDAGSNQLRCASCDPTGARPTGAAALDVFPAGGYLALYTPHQLADDGSRLFFDTQDALLPGASNGLQNVYEYEGGHLHLLSDGGGDFPSYFMDASPSDDDVFFATADQLVPQDTDQRVDIYDARVGGGFPTPPAAAPPCSSNDTCQGAPGTAPPAPTAASITFTGPGNASPGAATPRVRVLSRAVHGSIFLLTVRVPAKGRIAITGAGIKTVRKTVSKAGTYKLKVTLTAKERRALKHKRKLKLKLRVAYTPASGTPSSVTLSITDKA